MYHNYQVILVTYTASGWYHQHASLKNMNKLFLCLNIGDRNSIYLLLSTRFSISPHCHCKKCVYNSWFLQSQWQKGTCSNSCETPLLTLSCLKMTLRISISILTFSVIFLLYFKSPVAENTEIPGKKHCLIPIHWQLYHMILKSVFWMAQYIPNTSGILHMLVNFLKENCWFSSD